MSTVIWQDQSGRGEDTPALFGHLDENKKLIEDRYDVTIRIKDGQLEITGEDYDLQATRAVLDSMEEIIHRQDYVTKEEVSYLLDVQNKDADLPVGSMLKDVIVTTSRGKPIRAKTIGQKRYVDAINENGYTFGIGPAGTGKTYLAMAMAVKAFKAGRVSRIILTRPAVEAGESLGFLPGDLQEKIDPYLRPLYDALFEILGNDTYLKLKERGLIEVAPLAYMRGRTLDNSFIVLDEAQNTTPQQMKMFLTRMGYGSKAVITGDITQVDLPNGKSSGLKTIQHILRDIDGIAFCYFNRADVVRHPLVQKVIDAFEKYEGSQGGGHGPGKGSPKKAKGDRSKDRGRNK